MAEHGGVREFFDKIFWEGGIYAALDYGLTVDGYDLPADMVESWNALRRLHADMDPLMTQFGERYDSRSDYDT